MSGQACLLTARLPSSLDFIWAGPSWLELLSLVHLRFSWSITNQKRHMCRSFCSTLRQIHGKIFTFFYYFLETTQNRDRTYSFQNGKIYTFVVKILLGIQSFLSKPYGLSISIFKVFVVWHLMFNCAGSFALFLQLLHLSSSKFYSKFVKKEIYIYI